MALSLTPHILASESSAPATGLGRKPSWLKMKMPGGEEYSKLLKLVNDQKLHTVCQSAKCPNMGECWAAGTATLMILGDVCTRSCGFCHIATGRPPTLDLDEPRRVGKAVAAMDLKHTVITSVNRDELPDGGAAVWAETIRQIRLQSPGTSVEVLIPDFCGDWDALQLVLDAEAGHPQPQHRIGPAALQAGPPAGEVPPVAASCCRSPSSRASSPRPA